MPTSRKLVYAALIIILLAFLPLLVQKGVANAYHFKSLYYLKLWERNSKADEEQYFQAKVAATHAYSLDSANPHYLLTLAKVLEWGGYAKFEAINMGFLTYLYETAINQRPLWPNAYADYGAMIAFNDGELDKAWTLLLQGRDKGPYTPEVIRQILAVGFAFWGELTIEQKQQVIDIASIAVESKWDVKLTLQSLAKQYDRTQILCTFYKYSDNNLSESAAHWIIQSLCHQNYK
ncbi:hypothetical protein L2735_00760 [Shewanella olleyana]|uniref:hypothetical protein n=1 Tax=Shewanella olleyana TaxID=135626 RepID=UPI00200BD899|nr:hypothetical protein [Shewanella olleyana]MCL1065357.1 hypothetical protein [Shewanella olleyana]